MRQLVHWCGVYLEWRGSAPCPDSAQLTELLFAAESLAQSQPTPRKPGFCLSQLPDSKCLAHMAAAPQSGILDIPIVNPNALKRDIAETLFQRFWPGSGPTTPAITVDEHEPYFNYLQQECLVFSNYFHAIETWADMVVLLDIIRDNPQASLSELVTLMQNAHPGLATDRRKLLKSMEFVVQIWLLVSVKILMPLNKYELENSLPWPENKSLEDVLKQNLLQPPSTHNASLEEFTMQFNVIDMNKIAGFRIIWTNDLGDHLSIRGSSIYLFHQISVLQRIKESDANSPFISSSLVDETIATLNLLIPHSMPGCNTWLQGQINRLGLDSNLMYRQTASRRKGAYVHWQERLLLLSEAFGRSKPSTLFQWWYDRRDMGQWWSFWLVITGIFLTVLFGLIQSITGILQVVGSGS